MNNTFEHDPNYCLTVDYHAVYEDALDLKVSGPLYEEITQNPRKGVYVLGLGTTRISCASLTLGAETLVGDEYSRDFTIHVHHTPSTEYQDMFTGFCNKQSQFTYVTKALSKASIDRDRLLGKSVPLLDHTQRSTIQGKLTRKGSNQYHTDVLLDSIRDIGYFWIEAWAPADGEISLRLYDFGSRTSLVEPTLIEPDYLYWGKDVYGEDEFTSADVIDTSQGQSIIRTAPKTFRVTKKVKTEFNLLLQKLQLTLDQESFSGDETDDERAYLLMKLALRYLPAEILEEIIGAEEWASYLLNTTAFGAEHISITLGEWHEDKAREIDLVVYADREHAQSLVEAAEFILASTTDDIAEQMSLDTEVIEGIDEGERGDYEEIDVSVRDECIEREAASAHLNISLMLSPGQSFTLREMILTTILALHHRGFELRGSGFGLLKVDSNEDGHIQEFLHTLEQGRAALKS